MGQNQWLPRIPEAFLGLGTYAKPMIVQRKYETFTVSCWPDSGAKRGACVWLVLALKCFLTLGEVVNFWWSPRSTLSRCTIPIAGEKSHFDADR